MAKTDSIPSGRSIDKYEHKGQTRLNNPPVGLVTPETDKLNGKTRFEYDPHLDPQLVWAGKAERTSFDVPRVSLHVHERIDPSTVIRALRAAQGALRQMSLFEFSEENPPLREAIEFYKHKHNWSNRLIAGDSLLVMNSLLEREGMAGQVQVVYIDPPYGIKYGSNFQPFFSKVKVTDGKDQDLSQEPEMVRAFRDTWELGIHSYLAYLRDRLLLARQLLRPEGSVFVQISIDNVHHVRELMDEVFGSPNLIAQIIFRKTAGAGSPSGYVERLPETCDYLLWYAKDLTQLKIRRLFQPKEVGGAGGKGYTWVEEKNGERRRMRREEIGDPSILPKGSRVFTSDNLTSQTGGPTTIFPVSFEGKEYVVTKGGWKTNREGIQRLLKAKRLMPIGDTLRYVRYFEDFAYQPLVDLWFDTSTAGFTSDKIFVVQTNPKVVERCLLMASDPGDLVLDPTCGSGTTAFCAEKWGRRWITCDTSRIALALTRQRLMSSIYDYYELAHAEEGVSSGFVYQTTPHIQLRSIANHEPPILETLYDRPNVDRSRVRVTGPFTVEAVPAPTARSLTAQGVERSEEADSSVSRTGETLRQSDWRGELLKTGIRGRKGDRLEFVRVEPLPAHRWLQAEGQTKGPGAERVVFSFGPDYAPLEPRQVAAALQEAQHIVPKPTIVVFTAFQFDPQAAKDIDETDWPGVTILKAQMNPDLFTEDLKKHRSSNESFWLVGQPDAVLSKVKEGKEKGKWVVEVRGFDYYDVVNGVTESGGADRISMWFLDTDYDGRSIFPRQAFFPMANDKQGWSKLSANLHAEIDEARAEVLRGTKSLPFEPGPNRTVAVKIIDDRGVESLRVLEVR